MKGTPKEESRYLVPHSGGALSKRSEALVLRGVRDLEAAERIQARAEYQIGWACECGPVQSFAEAVVHYRKAAGLGHITAYICLCRMYERGRGVDHDPQEAKQWFARVREMAERGDREAQTACSVLYKEGWGVEKDYGESALWAMRATEDGTAPHQAGSAIWLAILYRYGCGVPKDFGEVERWLRRAVLQPGYSSERGQAFYDLGQIYSGEEDDPERSSRKDVLKAYASFKVSAEIYELAAEEETRIWAKTYLMEKADMSRSAAKRVSTQMSASQFADAELLGNEWPPRP